MTSQVLYEYKRKEGALQKIWLAVNNLMQNT